MHDSDEAIAALLEVLGDSLNELSLNKISRVSHEHAFLDFNFLLFDWKVFFFSIGHCILAGKQYMLNLVSFLLKNNLHACAPHLVFYLSVRDLELHCLIIHVKSY